LTGHIRGLTDPSLTPTAIAALTKRLAIRSNYLRTVPSAVRCLTANPKVTGHLAVSAACPLVIGDSLADPGIAPLIGYLRRESAKRATAQSPLMST
jgi:hypothetical protein